MQRLAKLLTLISLSVLLVGAQGCSTVAPEEPVAAKPQFPVGKPKGVPIHRRVYRRPGRLGPAGGMLGYQEKFEYPGVAIVHHPEVDKYVDLFTRSQRSYVGEALGRRARYLPQIEATLKRFKLPVELANLAFIESRFSPSIRSKDGSTVGLWQLSAATARNYGLVVNKKVDERTDVVKSTEAAARFLASLFDSLGDWYLAAAAWNTGPVRIQKALDDATASDSLDALDVFELTSRGIVCDTTRQFVAKLGALVIITKDLEKYGFPTDVSPVPEKIAASPSPSSDVADDKPAKKIGKSPTSATAVKGTDASKQSSQSSRKKGTKK
ncbi:MAG: lytic transglycosylase domain-containing protein [Bdellovibrionota bacterium]